MAYLIVRRKDDNIVEWAGNDEYATWQDVAGDPVTHFTIAEADNSWGLPSDGFDYIKVWHKNKPINPLTGRKNPTIVNCNIL